MSTYPPTPATTLRRHPERGSYDRETVHGILDEALFCHVGFVADGRPFVIPCIHARSGSTIYLHGAATSRLLRSMAAGGELCVTATLLDGLVLARSVFSHSMNYRSVVVLGPGRAVTDPDEKRAALAAIVEHVVPGRSADAREPNAAELDTTAVVAVELGTASAKIRRGPPKDTEADLGLAVWAGEIPLRLVPLLPIRDAQVPDGTPTPDYVMDYARPTSG